MRVLKKGAALGIGNSLHITSTLDSQSCGTHAQTVLKTNSGEAAKFVKTPLWTC